MRLEFPNRVSAQAFADAVHTRMTVQVPHYSLSVSLGHTQRWAIPYQDVDENGQPVASEWFANVKDRCIPVMTPGERGQIKEHQNRPSMARQARS